MNPPAERLSKENAVLSGRSTRYFVPDFEGCLSIKSVVSGNALWRAENRDFNLYGDCWLILNDRQHYSMTIDSLTPVTTFCLFFERGFVEDIYRGCVTPCDRLLDDPYADAPSEVTFFTRIEPGGPVTDLLKRFRRNLAGASMSGMDWDHAFLRVGEQLISEQSNALKVMSRLPALSRSTRLEVYRRVLRGRDFMLSHLSEAIQLKEIAAAACLSPFHFHRNFTCAFGETPHRYMTVHRLERAARLLQQTDSTVTEACFSAGFQSPASFSNLFRRHFGVPPSRFSKIE